MKVRIIHESSGFTPGEAWWDSHIGEAFPLKGIFDGIPRQYEVDVSVLKEAKELTVDRAYVPYFAAVLEDD